MFLMNSPTKLPVALKKIKTKVMWGGGGQISLFLFCVLLLLLFFFIYHTM